MSTTITAAQVRELRDITDAPMMECKKALEATGGDIKLAVEELRKKGRAKADKKADRVAAEGVILIQSTDTHAVMLEINSETDFVARDENFLAFANKAAMAALNAKQASTVESLSDLMDEERRALIAKVGENINIRRLVRTQHNAPIIGSYLHGSRIGVVVEMEGGSAELAKDIAMHIAACKPLVVAANDVSADLINKEKEIFAAQAAGSGKPANIIEKMIEGRLKKFLDEVSLLGQPFVKDPDTTVGALLERNHAKVLGFTRFEVGEGIEKQEENFVEAVMAQAQGAR